MFFVNNQRPKITVRIQDEVLALQTYYNSYFGAEKTRSASDRPKTRDAQHTELRVLNGYICKYSAPHAQDAEYLQKYKILKI